MSTTLKEFLVTFGQQYRREPHPKVKYANPDGWLSIMAHSYEQAREMAFQELGPAWCFIYERGVDQLDEQLFPLGELHQVIAHNIPEPGQPTRMSSKAGFTMVEVMIIIVIIGLLAAMAIPAYQKIRAEKIRFKIMQGETVEKKQRDYLKKYDAARGILVRTVPLNVETTDFKIGDRLTIEGKKHQILKVDDFYVITRTSE